MTRRGEDEVRAEASGEAVLKQTSSWVSACEARDGVSGVFMDMFGWLTGLMMVPHLATMGCLYPRDFCDLGVSWRTFVHSIGQVLQYHGFRIPCPSSLELQGAAD